MFFEATRIIQEMRNATRERTTGALPRVVVWENVRGALTSNNGNDFKAILDTMADIGALEQEWSVLDSQHFGVPHRRRRLFLISIFSADAVARCPNPLLPVKASSIRRSTPCREEKQEHAYRLEGSVEEDCRAIAFSHTQSFDLQPSFVAFPTLRRSGAGHAVAIATDNPPEMIIRRLTAIECERLMGWNDDHTRWRADGKEQTNSVRYKQCGNGVVTPVAKWIATQIKPLLG